MPGQTQSAMPSALPSLTAVRIDAVIRVYDDAGNVIETHEQAGEFREP
jgi:hypothetical protein